MLIFKYIKYILPKIFTFYFSIPRLRAKPQYHIMSFFEFKTFQKLASSVDIVFPRNPRHYCNSLLIKNKLKWKK